MTTQVRLNTNIIKITFRYMKWHFKSITFWMVRKCQWILRTSPWRRLEPSLKSIVWCLSFYFNFLTIHRFLNTRPVASGKRSSGHLNKHLVCLIFLIRSLSRGGSLWPSCLSLSCYIFFASENCNFFKPEEALCSKDMASLLE